MSERVTISIQQAGKTRLEAQVELPKEIANDLVKGCARVVSDALERVAGPTPPSDSEPAPV